MYDLSFGRIIDTPGIKGFFGVVDMEPGEISGYFSWIFKLNQCKFNNSAYTWDEQCAEETR
jgi:ribosome biogenesis GTPase